MFSIMATVTKVQECVYVRRHDVQCFVSREIALLLSWWRRNKSDVLTGHLSFWDTFLLLSSSNCNCISARYHMYSRYTRVGTMAQALSYREEAYAWQRDMYMMIK